MERPAREVNARLGTIYMYVGGGYTSFGVPSKVINQP